MVKKEVWSTVLTFVTSVLLFFAIGCNRQKYGVWDETAFERIEGVDDFMEISWLMESRTDEQDEETVPKRTWFQEIIENRFNVSIRPVELEIRDYWSFQAFLESDQFPDCGMMDMDPYLLFNNGIIRPVSEPMIRANMQNYSEFLDEYHLTGWQILAANLSSSREYEKEYLTLTFPSARDEIPQEGVATRVDWARAVGFEFPNYEEKKRALDKEKRVYWLSEDISVDRWEQLLLAYRDGDPDGNGKIDTIPWPAEQRAYSGYSWMWTGIRGCFGPVEGPILEDDELTMAEISDSYKEWCKLAQRWIQDALIDKENLDRTAYFAWKKIAQGQIASAPVYLWGIDQDQQSIMPPSTMAGEKGAEVVVVPSLAGPTGKRGPYVLPRWGRKYFFSRDVGDEKLKRILQIIEFLYFSGEENFIFAHFGKPGVHFYWEGDPWNSKPVPKKAEDIPKGYSQIGGFGEPRNQTYFKDFMLVEIPRINAYTIDLVRFEVPQRIFQLYSDLLSGEIPDYHVKWPYRYDLLYDQKYAELMEEHYDELNLHRLRFFWYITNEWIDVDEEWDSYLEGWKLRGGEEILEALNDLPKTADILGKPY